MELKNIKIDRRLHEQLKIRVIRNGESLASLTQRYLERMLKTKD